MTIAQNQDREQRLLHQHFKEISSTQDYIKENNFPKNTDVLISCEHQTNGHGQYSRKWDAHAGTLCFSCLIAPNEVTSLTSLEAGCILHKYFTKNFQTSLKLKWPNDLLTLDKKKVAGILLHSYKKNQFILGIGINYTTSQSQKELPQSVGFITGESYLLNKEEQAKTLYHYILNHRMTSQQTTHYWNENCAHLQQPLTLIDNEKKHSGIFQGIGPNGEAILKISTNELKSFYSGSIII